MLTCLISCLWLCFTRIYVFVCFLPCFMLRSASVHAYMLGFTFFHVYVLAFTYSHTLPCLCLDLHFYMLSCSDLGSHMLICLDLWFHMLVCLDLCSICFMPCACVLNAMFVCLDLGYVCHAMCYCSPFVALSFFLAFGLLVRTWCRPYGLSHCPYTLAHIKGFGSPVLHVYACLLLYFIFNVSLVLGFAMFGALHGLDLVWLHSTPTRPCLGVIAWDASLDARSLYAYPSLFSLRAIICLSCLFVSSVGFICIFTRLLTCLCMSLAC